MAKMVHTMIRAFDEERSLKFYKDAFGLRVKRHLDVEGFSLSYLGNEETDYEIELIMDKSRDKPYDHGSGYGHMAFMVPDLKSTHTRLTELGYAPGELVEVATDGGPAVSRFFYIQDPDGYQIEVLQGSSDPV